MPRRKPTASEADPETCAKVVNLRDCGTSWRDIERIMKLKPCNGMTAVRCYEKIVEGSLFESRAACDPGSRIFEDDREYVEVKKVAWDQLWHAVYWIKPNSGRRRKTYRRVNRLEALQISMRLAR